MSTFIFIGSGCLVALILLSRIRGLDHFLKPLFALLYMALSALTINLLAWAMYVCKRVVGAHVELARHLVLPDTRIDPTVPMREELRK